MADDPFANFDAFTGTSRPKDDGFDAFDDSPADFNDFTDFNAFGDTTRSFATTPLGADAFAAEPPARTPKGFDQFDALGGYFQGLLTKWGRISNRFLIDNVSLVLCRWCNR
jgi:hypothetical protein